MEVDEVSVLYKQLEMNLSKEKQQPLKEKGMMTRMACVQLINSTINPSHEWDFRVDLGRELMRPGFQHLLKTSLL
ncbi:protein diaphanous homolog 1 [Ciconia maguari]